MYIPSQYKIEQESEMVEFMQKFSFATLISSLNDTPIATHLPFLVTQNIDNQIILTSHFAKANPQWKKIQDTTPVLTIFSEPHAYISPQHYEKQLNVPTWNYMAVHAYGYVQLIEEEQKTMQILEQTIEFYEMNYKKQWNDLPQNYKIGLAKGVVAFEIKISELQGKKKLSQNKTLQEQKNIIESLFKSDFTNENLIAEYMKKNIK